MFVLAMRLGVWFRLGLAAGFLTMGWEPADAEQPSILSNPGATTATQSPGAASAMAAQLAKAEQQITSGHIWTPPNDNASDTMVSILAALATASGDDWEIARGLPSRFTRQAGVAIAAGRYDEAAAFLRWAKVFISLPEVTAGSPDPAPPNGSGADTLAPALPTAPADPRVAHWSKVSPNAASGGPGPGTEAEEHAFVEAPVVPLLRPSPVVPPMAQLSVGSPAPVKDDTATSVSAHCRAIVLKVQLGEEPSNADRAYLRQGCPRS